MKRHHFALFTLMGNGHINPTLPLCLELVSRGHRVTCPATERYSRVFSEAGAELVPYVETPVGWALRAENEAKSQLPLDHPGRLDTTELEWAHFVRSNAEFLTQVGPYYESHRPDFVLYNRYCIPGRIIARRAGASAVQLSPHFAYHGLTRYWSKGQCVSPSSVAAFAERLDTFLRDYGFHSNGNLWHLEHLNIHFIPREFQYRSELFDERFLFVGGLRERRFSPAWEAVDTQKPLVLISGYSGLPDTQYSNEVYFRTFIDALAGTDFHCVLSIGDRMSPHSLGPLPANFQINQRASHLEILPSVDLFACHGGMGSTLEALCKGVPVLAVPATPYTLEVAYRVAELGLGNSLPVERFNAPTIRDTVREMLNDRPLVERVSRMQQIFASSEGAAAAVDRIERYLFG